MATIQQFAQISTNVQLANYVILNGLIYVPKHNGVSNTFSLTTYNLASNLPVVGADVSISNPGLLSSAYSTTLIAYHEYSSSFYLNNSGTSNLYSLPISGGALTLVATLATNRVVNMICDKPGNLYIIGLDISIPLFEIFVYSNSYALEARFTLSFGSVYRPYLLVFGQNDNELYALCSVGANSNAIVLITNPSNNATRTTSVFKSGLNGRSVSIAYDQLNSRLVASQNTDYPSGGNQKITDLNGQVIADPLNPDVDLPLPEQTFYSMQFDDSGNLYYPVEMTTSPTNFLARVNLGAPPLCLAEGTRVLTPGGYIPVEQLKKHDYITTSDGRNTMIKHIHHSQHFNVCELEAPFMVPADALAIGVPLHDVRLSPDHLVLVGDDCWLSPRHMAKRSDKVVQYSLGESIHYYAIMTTNYFEDNLVIEDGVVVESYGYRHTLYDETANAYRRAKE